MLQFNGLLVLESNLKFEGIKLNIETDSNFNFQFEPMFLPEEENSFCIRFSVELFSDDKLFIFKVSALAQFTSSIKLDEGFKNSDFPKINAPAIAFPYLRAYIANTMLSSGYEPIHLPSINFVQLVENTDAKNKMVSPKRTSKKKNKNN